MISHGKNFVRVMDPLTESDLQALDLEKADLRQKDLKVRAFPTGETRTPRKGEWYISGAIPEAYRAKSDLSSRHVMARLILVRETMITSFEVIKIA